MFLGLRLSRQIRWSSLWYDFTHIKILISVMLSFISCHVVKNLYFYSFFWMKTFNKSLVNCDTWKYFFFNMIVCQTGGYRMVSKILLGAKQTLLILTFFLESLYYNINQLVCFFHVPDNLLTSFAMFINLFTFWYYACIKDEIIEI